MKPQSSPPGPARPSQASPPGPARPSQTRPPGPARPSWASPPGPSSDCTPTQICDRSTPAIIIADWAHYTEEAIYFVNLEILSRFWNTVSLHADMLSVASKSIDVPWLLFHHGTTDRNFQSNFPDAQRLRQ